MNYKFTIDSDNWRVLGPEFNSRALLDNYRSKVIAGTLDIPAQYCMNPLAYCTALVKEECIAYYAAYTTAQNNVTEAFWLSAIKEHCLYDLSDLAKLAYKQGVEIGSKLN